MKLTSLGVLRLPVIRISLSQNSKSSIIPKAWSTRWSALPAIRQSMLARVIQHHNTLDAEEAHRAQVHHQHPARPAIQLAVQRRAQPRNSGGVDLTPDPHGDYVWVLNRSSTVLTCGITNQWPSGMIASCDGTTALSDLPTACGLVRIAGPKHTIEERGDPGAPA
jgi:hypothetical protein